MAHLDSILSRIKRRLSRLIVPHIRSTSATSHSSKSAPPPHSQTALPTDPITISQASPTLHPLASLLGCSPEIRLLIYDHLFHLPKPAGEYRSAQNAYTRARLQDLQRDRGLTPAANVLLTCRQLHHECTPLLPRTALIVPRSQVHQGGDAVPAAVLLGASRLARVPPGQLQRLGVREIVVREFVEALPHALSAAYEDGLRLAWLPRLALHVDTAYLQLCICHGSSHRCELGSLVQLSAAPLARAVHAMLVSLHTLRRVVVYYCGIRDGWCSARGVIRAPQARVVVDGMKTLFETDGATAGWQSEGWWAERIRSVEGNGEDDGVWRYNLTFSDIGDWSGGSVEVEFWDSFQATGKRCVLE